MNTYQTTRQQCESKRPQSTKLAEFMKQKKMEKELEMYEAPRSDETDISTSLDSTNMSLFTEEEQQRSKYGTPCALDYYPSAFRSSEWETRSDTPTQRQDISQRRLMKSKDIKTSVRSIMQNKLSPQRKDRTPSPSRFSRVNAVPKYARPSHAR
jgi:hypothetical protein